MAVPLRCRCVSGEGRAIWGGAMVHRALEAATLRCGGSMSPVACFPAAADTLRLFSGLGIPAALPRRQSSRPAAVATLNCTLLSPLQNAAPHYIVCY